MQFFLHTYGDCACPPEWHVPIEYPFYNRLYFVRGGHAEYVSEVERFVLQQGHIYLFPQNVAYDISHDPSNPFRTAYFHLTSVPNTSVVINCTPQAEADKELLALIVGNLATFSAEVLGHLLSAYLTRTVSVLFESEPDHSLDAALSYIHSHVFEPVEELSSAKLAGLACYNESYFIRKFKAKTGLSPRRYVLDLKLKCALEMLGTLPLSEVCRRTGFGDYDNFRKRFKDKYGINPSQYANHLSRI